MATTAHSTPASTSSRRAFFGAAAVAAPMLAFRAAADVPDHVPYASPSYVGDQIITDAVARWHEVTAEINGPTSHRSDEELDALLDRQGATEEIINAAVARSMASLRAKAGFLKALGNFDDRSDLDDVGEATLSLVGDILRLIDAELVGSSAA